jgi:heavy metal sensor kinase
MSGRALKPVDQIARTARRISGQNLSERLPLRMTGDELDRLSATLNEMLARLEGAFGRITQFTADASHELRTPVAIIRTTAEVTTARPRTPEEHEKAWAQVISQTERTAQLIDGLLLLARADAGWDDLSFEAFDLAETLRAVTAEMEILAEASGLRLTAELPREHPMTGDSDALRRLLLILLDNAIKYTAPGGAVHVDMRLDGSSAVIQVRDTGAGIAPEDLPHIFDRFYRTARDRSRKTGGAGLGLAIAQWLAARHGGTIQVESTPGSGSTFRLILPDSPVLQNPSA